MIILIILHIVNNLLFFDLEMLNLLLIVSHHLFLLMLKLRNVFLEILKLVLELFLEWLEITNKRRILLKIYRGVVALVLLGWPSVHILKGFGPLVITVIRLRIRIGTHILDLIEVNLGMGFYLSAWLAKVLLSVILIIAMSRWL